MCQHKLHRMEKAPAPILRSVAGLSFMSMQLPQINTSPIVKIAQKHNVCYHLYVDDTQLYVMFIVRNRPTAATQLEELSKR